MAGQMVHAELPAKDVGRAKEFWASAFGWEFGDPMGMEYFMARTDENQGVAVFAKPEATGITLYFGTDDIDATIGKIRAGGGTADDKSPIPNTGWFTLCSDTGGNSFGIFESDESVTA